MNANTSVITDLDLNVVDPKYDLLVFIGRMQPFHAEHQRVIDIALTKAKNVLVLVGSAGSARNIRNPWSYVERKMMIKSCYTDADNLSIEPIFDKTYNDDAWVKQIQEIVKKHILKIMNPDGFHINGVKDAHVGLIGCAKDHTSFYLKLFPQWDSVNVDLQSLIHATGIRDPFFKGNLQKHEVSGGLLPAPVANYLFDYYKDTFEYSYIAAEYEFIRNYKKQWEAAPYPVKHVTVDSILTQSGHVLLVKRKSSPGKGLWALPGGHLNEYEKIEDGAIRELREETLIKVPEKVLRGSIVRREVYDDPHRSNLGRVITHAYHIKLPDSIDFPLVKGSDDAEKAKFVPLSDLKEDQFFDDHYAILQHILGL